MKKKEWIKLPVIGLGSAGKPKIREEDILDYIEYCVKETEADDYFALKINGSSMEPRIYDGDLIIVHRQCDVEKNDVAVVAVGDADATVKKIVMDKGYIILVPFNPGYVPLRYDEKAYIENNVRIIGKVTGFISRSI